MLVRLGLRVALTGLALLTLAVVLLLSLAVATKALEMKKVPAEK